MEALVETINAFARQADQDTRRQLSGKLQDLAISLETPNDTLLRVVYKPLELMVAYIAVELGLFKRMTAADKPETAVELATQTNTDPELMTRILRYLASSRFVKETSEGTYQANQVTKTFTRPGYEDGIWFHFHFYNKALMAAPEVLEDNDFTDPTAWTQTPIQRAFDTKEPIFYYLRNHPDITEHFNRFMSNLYQDKPHWTTAVSFQDQCKDLTHNPNDVLFVDMGCGLGFESVHFREAVPNIPGRIVIQDLEPTLNQAPNHHGLEKMVHDFFNPQPIKGAKYYFLRNIMHDYQDAKCHEILANLIPAMSPHSVLLINDIIIPNTGAHWQAAQQDIAMMVALGSHERTERQWCTLLGDAGLVVRKMTTYSALMADGIIEAVLPEK